MILRWIAFAGAVINGVVWMALSLILVPISWAIVVGLLAFVATLPVMTAVIMTGDATTAPVQPVEIDPAVTTSI